jgi:hypothetical protein
MSGTAVLLDEVLELLSQAETPARFDFEQALLGLGCAPVEAELLSDYLPVACGRAFLRELKIVTSGTYQRVNADGSFGPPTALADDPLWREVEAFVEIVRTDPLRRSQFSLAASHSAEVNAVDNVVNAGTSLTELEGAHFASVFLATDKRRS